VKVLMLGIIINWKRKNILATVRLTYRQTE